MEAAFDPRAVLRTQNDTHQPLSVPTMHSDLLNDQNSKRRSIYEPL
jgi:hypothetical protein